MRKGKLFAASASLCLVVGAAALAGPAQQATLAHYKNLAATENAQSSFSAANGEAFFARKFAGGKPETPSCTTCHTASPANAGRTRAGKEIAPMALSKSPDRYTDLAKVEKWFKRNCTSVLGRECTASEKGDFLAFVMTK